MSHHTSSRRQYFLTANGGGLLDYQFLEDSLHSHLQVVGNEMRATFCIGSPRTSVFIVEVTDKQTTYKLLNLLPSDSALCSAILQSRQKLHS